MYNSLPRDAKDTTSLFGTRMLICGVGMHTLVLVLALVVFLSCVALLRLFDEMLCVYTIMIMYNINRSLHACCSVNGSSSVDTPLCNRCALSSNDYVYGVHSADWNHGCASWQLHPIATCQQSKHRQRQSRSTVIQHSIRRNIVV
jgi:hypothetical protein